MSLIGAARIWDWGLFFQDTPDPLGLLVVHPGVQLPPARPDRGAVPLLSLLAVAPLMPFWPGNPARSATDRDFSDMDAVAVSACSGSRARWKGWC
jgi:hypothetical protein